MDTNKVLAALCYFSVMFAPFLLPIIIYFVSDDLFVKGHAKSSLISHIIPVIFIPILFFTAIYDINQSGDFPILMLVATVVFSIISLIIFIWNLVRGIKILVK